MAIDHGSAPNKTLNSISLLTSLAVPSCLDTSGVFIKHANRCLMGWSKQKQKGHQTNTFTGKCGKALCRSSSKYS